MVKSLREQGVQHTINALFYTTPGAILAKLLGRPGYAAMEIAMAPPFLLVRMFWQICLINQKWVVRSQSHSKRSGFDQS